MRLLFAGAGAVGGFVAARTVDAGYDVTVLVHAPRARQLRQAPASGAAYVERDQP